MEFKDYYQILGVPRSATAAEIKSAYRKLARKFHPDVNPGDSEAEKRFREINEAHEVLGSEDNRKKYDQLGAHWKQAGAAGWPPGGAAGAGVPFDLGDLFEQFGSAGGTGRSSFFDMFFGSMGGGPGRAGASGFPGPGRTPGRARSDVEAVAEISVEEAFQGTSRTLTLERDTPCPTCMGRGRTDSTPCRTCRGMGQVTTPRTLEVRIPAGVKDGSRVRIRGEGAAGPGGSGDVYLQVRLRQHPVYEARGHDLYRDLRIPLYDAILGGEASFQGPGGSTLKVKIRPETQNGTQVRLTGQGLPRSSKPGPPAGDLYLRLLVELPTGLSTEQVSLFRRLAGRPE